MAAGRGIILSRRPGGSGGGGTPSGPAGGSLAGTYPDPTLAADSVGSSQIAAGAVTASEAPFAVPKALYDANTVLAANSDDTPAAVTMGASTILARLAAGNIKAASVSEIQTLLGIVPSTLYKKTTTKTVSNTVTETDLLNGEITIGANVMGVTGAIRIDLFGSAKQNSGSNRASPRMRLKFGGTTYIDHNMGGNVWSNNTGVQAWHMTALINNNGATNAQNITYDFTMDIISDLAAGGLFNAGSGTHFIPTAAGGVSLWTATGSNTGTQDTTASKLLEYTVVLPVADANCNMVLLGAVVQVL